jgi:hypothetical protein
MKGVSFNGQFLPDALVTERDSICLHVRVTLSSMGASV